MKEKEAKKAHLKIAIDSVAKEDYAGYLRDELNTDYERIEIYKELQRDLFAEALDAQNDYQFFEKIFFNDLEQVVIAKKKSLTKKWGEL